MNKTPNHHEQLAKQSLANRIYSIKSEFLFHVDQETINYQQTQHFKIHPNRMEKDYRVVELTKSQRQKSIEAMKWFIMDIEACIKHLED